ncbi:AhpC/TSA family protein [Ilumatobacter nonamiensis]|uniref:AhpC/TSA family protein n=1 Tax=Ilumatobacter nonamiensis TaxID=467093 RepID=UPI000349E3E9|nr:AhpC/TSA family protein [Ilumatobacter nonamiensis]
MSERLADRAEVVLVTFTTPDRLDEYQQRRALGVPILIDADRSVYSAYGLGRGSLRAVWGWSTLRRYGEILRETIASSGVRHGMRQAAAEMTGATEDTRQLGGDFVIAPDGMLAWMHLSEGPADRPDVEAMVDAVERCAP